MEYYISMCEEARILQSTGLEAVTYYAVFHLVLQLGELRYYLGVYEPALLRFAKAKRVKMMMDEVVPNLVLQQG